MKLNEGTEIAPEMKCVIVVLRSLIRTWLFATGTGTNLCMQRQHYANRIFSIQLRIYPLIGGKYKSSQRSLVYRISTFRMVINRREKQINGFAPNIRDRQFMHE